MMHPLADEIITIAGQPVAGHKLSIQVMEQAVQERRVLYISCASNYGDHESGVYFADKLYFCAPGRIYPHYLVFPRPLPSEFSAYRQEDWEEIADVFAAFGVNPNG